MSAYDARSVAFLGAMGIVPLWVARSAPTDGALGLGLPDAAPENLSTPAPAAAATAADEATAAIASMSWDQLRAAVSVCTRCALCRSAQAPVFGEGSNVARLVVVAGATTTQDAVHGAPLSGEPGRLFDNMLGTLGLARGQGAYVSNLIKCVPTSPSGAERAPTADEAAACRPYLEREIALSGARMVLTLGQIAANGVLGKPLQQSLSGTRGSVITRDGVALVATLHPAEMLRQGTDKALAWADLCRIKTSDVWRT